MALNVFIIILNLQRIQSEIVYIENKILMLVHQVVNLSLKRLLSPIELYKNKRGLLRFVHRVFGKLDDIKIIGICRGCPLVRRSLKKE